MFMKKIKFYKYIILMTVGVFLMSVYLSDILRVNRSQAAILQLPEPTQAVLLSKTYDQALLKGIRIDPTNPLNLTFYIDSADEKTVSRQTAEKLVNYFLAALTVPQSEIWVNLSPYEHTRIVSDTLGITDLGKDLLSQDYILKQLSASITDPKTDLGQQYWSTVKKNINDALGDSSQITGFNKIWIVPNEAKVNEKDGLALITKSSLKAMLENDYVALNKTNVLTDSDSADKVVTDVLRNCILDKIDHDVNTGKNFSTLRQMYSALILAKWFKKKFNDSFYAYYLDQNKVSGIELSDKQIKDKIYKLYVKAFEKGVYNFIRTEKTPSDKVNKRRYFSGGFDVEGSAKGSEFLLIEEGINSSSVNEIFQGQINELVIEEKLLNKNGKILALSKSNLISSTISRLKVKLMCLMVAAGALLDFNYNDKLSNKVEVVDVPYVIQTKSLLLNNPQPVPIEHIWGLLAASKKGDEVAQDEMIQRCLNGNTEAMSFLNEIPGIYDDGIVYEEMMKQLAIPGLKNTLYYSLASNILSAIYSMELSDDERASRINEFKKHYRKSFEYMTFDKNVDSKVVMDIVNKSIDIIGSEEVEQSRLRLNKKYNRYPQKFIFYLTVPEVVYNLTESFKEFKKLKIYQENTRLQDEFDFAFLTSSAFAEGYILNAKYFVRGTKMFTLMNYPMGLDRYGNVEEELKKLNYLPEDFNGFVSHDTTFTYEGAPDYLMGHFKSQKDLLLANAALLLQDRQKFLGLSQQMGYETVNLTKDQVQVGTYLCFVYRNPARAIRRYSTVKLIGLGKRHGDGLYNAQWPAATAEFLNEIYGDLLQIPISSALGKHEDEVKQMSRRDFIGNLFKAAGVVGVAAVVGPRAFANVPEKTRPSLLSKSAVALKDGKLFVNNKPYQIRGFTYSPIDKGRGRRDGFDFNNIDEDIRLMSELGVNTLRIYHPITDRKIWDKFARAGIRIITNIPNYDDRYNPGPSIHNGSYLKFIKDFKDHPAFLLVEFGNEYNYHPEWFGGDINNWYKILNEAAGKAKAIDKNLIIATAHGDVPSIELVKRLSNVDLFGCNTYRWDDLVNELGNGENFFEQWREIRKVTGRNVGMYISEGGSDSFDSRKGKEDEAAHAKAILKIWSQVNTNKDICNGITFMSWRDEWWKAPGKTSVQDTVGHHYDVPYDNRANEEFFGIVKMNGQKKEVFDLLKKVWLASSALKAFVKEINEANAAKNKDYPEYTDGMWREGQNYLEPIHVDDTVFKFKNWGAVITTSIISAFAVATTLSFATDYPLAVKIVFGLINSLAAMNSFRFLNTLIFAWFSPVTKKVAMGEKVNTNKYRNYFMNNKLHEETKVTINIPVFKESFKVIKKTVDHAVAEARHTGKQVNIVVSEDGLMYYSKNNFDDYVREAKATKIEYRSEEQKELLNRIEYYNQYINDETVNFSLVARPYSEKNNKKIERRGQFKKSGNINFLLRLYFDYVEKGADDNVDYQKDLENMLGNDARKSYVAGDMFVGDFIVYLDKDSVTPKGIINEAIPDFYDDPSLSYIQCATKSTNPDENYFAALNSYFTNQKFSVTYPIKSQFGSISNVGHNMIVRTEHLRKVGLWAENNVSEDLSFQMDVMSKGYHGKYFDVKELRFEEEVSNTLDKEMTKWRRYAYGSAQLAFNPVKNWFKKGVFTKQIITFMKSKSLPWYAKFDIIIHLASYVGLFMIAPSLVLAAFMSVKLLAQPVYLLVWFLASLLPALSFTFPNHKVDNNEVGYSTAASLLKNLKLMFPRGMFEIFKSVVVVKGILQYFSGVKTSFSPTEVGETDDMPLRDALKLVFLENTWPLYVAGFVIANAYHIIVNDQSMHNFIFSYFLLAQWIFAPFVYTTEFVAAFKNKFFKMGRLYKGNRSPWRNRSSKKRDLRVDTDNILTHEVNNDENGVDKDNEVSSTLVANKLINPTGGIDMDALEIEIDSASSSIKLDFTPERFYGLSYEILSLKEVSSSVFASARS